MHMMSRQDRSAVATHETIGLLRRSEDPGGTANTGQELPADFMLGSANSVARARLDARRGLGPGPARVPDLP